MGEVVLPIPPQIVTKVTIVGPLDRPFSVMFDRVLTDEEQDAVSDWLNRSHQVVHYEPDEYSKRDQAILGGDLGD